MKRKLKKGIKNIINKLGYTLIKSNNLNLVKNNEEINVYGKNNLLNNFYKLLINQNYFPKVIYDIGANKGGWTYECLKHFPHASYYLFEPQLDLKMDIDNLLQDYDNVTLFSFGLGDKNDVLSFTIHDRDDSCTYAFSKEEARIRGFKQIDLPILRLDSFVKDKNLKPPDILKIDAEGLDLKVLYGAGKLLENVEVIMVEVAIVNDNLENTALKVLNYLDSKDYKLFDITDINRPFSNQVLWLCEFVFIKKRGILDKDYK